MKKGIIFLFLLIIIPMLFLLGVFSNYTTDTIEIIRNHFPITKAENIKKIDFNSEIISMPILLNDYLFIQTRNEILSYDLNNFIMNWKTDINGNNRNCPMTHDENYLYAPYTDGVVVLDINTGRVIREMNVSPEDNYIESIVSNGNTVYFAVFSKSLYAYDLDTGKLLWETWMENRAHIDLFLTGDSILVDSGISLTSHQVDTGEMLWHKDYSIDNVSISNNNEELNGIRYLNQEFYYIRIDNKTGNISSSEPLSDNRIKCITPIGDELLISGNGLTLYDTGKAEEYWHNNTIDQLACPVMLGDRIFVRKEIRDLYEFDLETGKIISRYPLAWRYGYPSRHSIDPIVYEDKLIIPTGINQLGILTVMPK